MLTAAVEFVLAAENISYAITALSAVLAALLTGGILILGPQRRLLSADATDKAVHALDTTLERLERRLRTVEEELEDTRNKLAKANARIADLEERLELAGDGRKREVDDLRRQLDLARDERATYTSRISELEAEVADFRRRYPGIERRKRDAGPPPGTPERREHDLGPPPDPER